MSAQIALTIILTLSVPSIALSQFLEGTKPAADADSLFIRVFTRSNNVRAFYGGQGNRLVLGSLRDGSPDLKTDIYNNTNDFLGVGASYKLIDGDASFSLPGTTYLKEERSNLEQVKFLCAYTRRKIAYRGYLCDSKGVAITGNNDEYNSVPSLHEFRVGLQATYIANEKKYSYRAALYQRELQIKTAGSFLLRTEAFYRNLGGSGQQIVPEPFNNEAKFGEQAGLTYLKAPGILIMPGYGANFIFNNSRIFISPLLLAGAGAAFNNYNNSNSEKQTHFNMEYSLHFFLSAGYSGHLMYCRLLFMYATNYAPIQPSYLLSKDIILTFLVGFRFKDMEKVIPRTL